jgi:hypothetical protein
MNPRTKDFVFYRALPALLLVGAAYEAWAHGLLSGVNQSHTASSTPMMPTFLSSAAQPQAGDVSFVVASAHDCQNGALLINDTPNFAKATRTAYIESDAKGAWTAKTIKGKTVTVRGVAPTDYTDSRGRTKPELHVEQASQLGVQ